MGRTLKRVPMGFSWPIGKVWGGYLNPFSHQAVTCDKCDGTGHSAIAKRLQDQWYGDAPFVPEDRGSKRLTIENKEVRAFAKRNVERSPSYFGSGEEAINKEALRLANLWNNQWSHHLNEFDVAALVKADRLLELTHTFKEGEGWVRNAPSNIPTPEEVNAWSITGFGHDSINQWVVIEAECIRMGYETSCDKCHGEGSIWPSDEIKKQSEEWLETEPPEGIGFQLWETTSEGSPKSPVFATIEELCAWCEMNATTFANNKASATEWRKMLDKDFVCHIEGNVVFM